MTLQETPAAAMLRAIGDPRAAAMPPVLHLSQRERTTLKRARAICEQARELVEHEDDPGMFASAEAWLAEILDL